MKNSNLYTHESWVEYHYNYLDKIRYFLPVTLFSISIWSSLQNVTLRTLLSKLHINRHVPLNQHFGTTIFGGLELNSIKTSTLVRC